MKVLVTGGAGYIGSVVTEELIREGNYVVVLDSLKQGHREAIVPEAVFVQVDLGDAEEVDRVFRGYHIEVVMHLAAETAVENSITDPGSYFRNNVVYGVNLLDIMLKHSLTKIVFSSSAAVYGEPKKVPVKESDLKRPINPYGELKLMFERILHWYHCAYDLKFIALRYFNAAGATERFGEDHSPETHLIPNVLKVALGQQNHVSVFGVDYPTRDRSCVRDYVHVIDIARAHLVAMKHLERDIGNKVYNLGSEEGYSVLEVVDVARKVTSAEIPLVVHPRRSGDPAALVASSKLARSELGWQPVYPSLETIIESAWRWQRKHPYGYKR